MYCSSSSTNTFVNIYFFEILLYVSLQIVPQLVTEIFGVIKNKRSWSKRNLKRWIYRVLSPSSGRGCLYTQYTFSHAFCLYIWTVWPSCNVKCNVNAERTDTSLFKSDKRRLRIASACVEICATVHIIDI